MTLAGRLLTNPGSVQPSQPGPYLTVAFRRVTLEVVNHSHRRLSAPCSWTLYPSLTVAPLPLR